MRKTFFDTLLEIAKKDKDIILLVDDLGFSHKEEFERVLPKQIINCGITEQAMTGIAAGLALGGKKPYIYGTIPFVIMRNYEQVRDDIAYQNLNVKIAGYSMPGFVGFTHNISKDEDIGILSHLPNLRIHIPETPTELVKVMRKSHKNPAYIRL